MKTRFITEQESHQHSLSTLNLLYEYDAFIKSIKSVIDMGCGREALDLEWWATRTTRDVDQRPLNIQCLGVDQHEQLNLATRYTNLRYQRQDFEQKIITPSKTKYDVVWCHDAFQYVIDPFQTLANWRKIMNQDAMLVLILPQTTNLEYNQQAFDQPDGVYWNWTMVSLIHVLAVSGFDCAGGFFKKNPNDPWLHAAVYKSEHAPMDPRTTKWYELAEKNLLPKSAADSVNRYGYLRQVDLVLPWLDKSLMAMADH